MNGITLPISFENTEALNKIYNLYTKEVIEICNKHNTPDLLQNIKINKDEKNCQFSIVSVGSYLKDSNEEKAVLEIISAFNKLC